MIPETSLRITAPAKINLYLHIIGQHANGLHLLDSLIAFADIHDTIYLEASSELSLEIDGPFANQLTTEPNNMVLKAARGLARLCDVNRGAQLQLTKNLPVASGIGGGSSNAAATLKGLIQLWGVQPNDQDLLGLALELGADVPACLNGKTAFMSGIGEKITETESIPVCSLVLVNSGRAVSTPSVFKTRAKSQSSFSKPGCFNFLPNDLTEFVSILKTCRNDLDQAAQVLCPEIGEVLGALEESQGSLLTRMSGSGATCFSLFASLEEAAAAALDLIQRHPDWWVKAGSLKSSNSCIN
jgi:4-diphosphocytidyl-2-C-methyl-D-erythritol kinase